jgi:hypothetical protein
MANWEYKVLILQTTDPLLDEEVLNMHGVKGWEMQSVIQSVIERGAMRVCYLKRPTTEEEQDADETMRFDQPAKK